jgi:hypothetical protein
MPTAVPRRERGVIRAATGYEMPVPALVRTSPRAHRSASAAVGRIAGPGQELFAHRPMGTQD